MKLSMFARGTAVAACLAVPASSYAWFFILPIPNMSKPGPLSTLIDALEKSEETKAVAFVSEDKTFGQKYWVWGQYSGHVPQVEADRIALSRCQASLNNAKNQNAGGKPLYDYGTKACELYSFANKSVSPRAGEWQAPSIAAITPPVQPAPSASQPIEPVVAVSASTDSAIKTLPSGITGKPAISNAPTNTTEAKPPVPNQNSQAGPSESATAKKLRELETLRKEALISEAEYQEKRKAILAAM